MDGQTDVRNWQAKKWVKGEKNCKKHVPEKKKHKLINYRRQSCKRLPSGVQRFIKPGSGVETLTNTAKEYTEKTDKKVCGRGMMNKGCGKK